MNILITGVNGFIGSSAADRLAGKHTITGVVKDESQIGTRPIRYIVHDFSKPFIMKKFPQDIDCILHFAATMDKTLSEQQMFRINTASTLDLLDYGKKIGIRKFIFASSGGVYGYSGNVRSETANLHPTDFYGQTKILSEQLVNHFNKHFTTVNLRLFFPYGAGQRNGIVPRLTDMIKNKQEITLYNNDNPRINPIHISDVLSAIEASLIIDGKYTINICGDEIISIHNLALMLSKTIGIDPQFKLVNNNGIKDLIGSNYRMRYCLGIKPIKPLRQGVTEFINMIDAHTESRAPSAISFTADIPLRQRKG